MKEVAIRLLLLLLLLLAIGLTQFSKQLSKAEAIGENPKKKRQEKRKLTTVAEREREIKQKISSKRSESLIFLLGFVFLLAQLLVGCYYLLCCAALFSC
jgi:hypothetical protein